MPFSRKMPLARRRRFFPDHRNKKGAAIPRSAFLTLNVTPCLKRWFEADRAVLRREA
jgi:hypothetical protein